LIELLQYTGSFILAVHKFPQMYRAYKERNELKGFSLTKFLMGAVGSLMMLLWALATGNYGIVGLNLICIAYESSIAVLIIRVMRRRGESWMKLKL